MENLELTNKMWQYIDELNWNTAIKTNNPISYIAEKYKFFDNNNIVNVHDLFNFIVNMRSLLEDKILGTKIIYPSVVLDNIDELCAHVVGLGVIMFEFVYNNPASIKLIAKNYTNGFEVAYDEYLSDK